LSIQIPSKIEQTLVEIKAKIDDINLTRKKLTSLKAKYVGTFRQIDTYFAVPKGRLKLRETGDQERAELVYYEREDIAAPKRSDVFIVKVQKPTLFKKMLENVLQTKVVVDKVREIYQLYAFEEEKSRRIRTHLDKVLGLGTFIEFEMEASGRTEEALKEDRRILELFMEKLGISRDCLQGLSYSDLLDRAKEKF